MSFNYSGLSKTAVKNIAKFGRSVTFRSVTVGTFDTSTGTKTGAKDVDKIIKAVITDYKDRQIDGEIIRRGDKQVMIAGSSVISPKTNDIIVDGSDYKIVNIETVQPGDTVLIYKLQVRK